jgi:hypothetical protein
VRRIFNLILLAGGAMVLLHLAMTLITETMSRSRWAMTEEGRAAIKDFVEKMSPYPTGGGPAQAALVLAAAPAPETISARTSKVFFDFNNQGRAVRTGWPAPSAGFLALNCPNEPSAQPHLLSFLALKAAEDDRGGPGEESPLWSRLVLWSDLDQNGRVDPGECRPLAELGLDEIRLASHFRFIGRPLPDGNFIGFQRDLWTRDGQALVLSEIYFNQVKADRLFAPVPLTPAAAELPDLPGSGLVRGLREAASLNPELQNRVESYLQIADQAERRAALEDLWSAWAAASGHKQTLAERAEAGRYRLTVKGLEGEDPAPRWRQILVLEAFHGGVFHPLPENLNPAQRLHPDMTAGGPGRRDLTLAFRPGRLESLSRAYEKKANQVYYGLAREAEPAGADAVKPAP